jgi:hypothetical protein
VIYLAVPYSHRLPQIETLRAEAVTYAAGVLMEEGHTVYSPITSSHKIQTLGLCNSWGYDEWLKHDTKFLDVCDQLYVLMLPGWSESTGVKYEIKYTKDSSRSYQSPVKPIKYIDPYSYSPQLVHADILDILDAMQ